MIQFTTIILVLATSTYASVIPSTPNLKATYRWEKSNNAHALSLHNTKDELLASACDSALNTSALKNTQLSFNIDSERPWDGNFLIGGQAYGIHWNDNDDKPRCAMAYSADFVETQCHFFAETSSTVEVQDLSAEHCWGNSREMSQVAAGRSIIDTSTAVPATNFSVDTRDTLLGRQLTDKSTILVGDGNPHQAAYNYQCTTTISCGDTTCSSGITSATTFTWGFTATASLYGWISGGFNVGSSETSSETQTCSGSSGQNVCVWHVEPYTAYTVQNQFQYCNEHGCDTTHGDPTVLSSPNVAQTGASFYCVINTCQSKGANYFTAGAAGGPPS